MFKTSLVDENIAITRGYSMAFGELSNSAITKLGNDLFLTLIQNCVPKGKEGDDAETRKYSVKSIIFGFPVNLSFFPSKRVMLSMFFLLN